MSRFAEGTAVNVGASRDELERLLTRFGATAFQSGWDGEKAAVGFVAHGRQVRIVIAYPAPTERRFTHTATGRRRTADAAAAEYQAEIRRVWRALAMLVKAKLVAVTEGVVTFDEEFLAHMVLPSGRRVGDEVAPRIVAAYDDGLVPALLPPTRKALT